MTSSQAKRQPINSNFEILESSKSFKEVITTILDEVKSIEINGKIEVLNNVTETLEKEQIEISKLKNTVSEIKKKLSAQ